MFSVETFDFLVENRLQDSRAWHNEHKQEYRQLVIKPLAELVTALSPTMLTIDEQFVCAPKIGKTISRINRDTRFSKDKTLYRDVMWISFERARDRSLPYGVPGFWVEVSPRGIFYGCGLYNPSPDTMNNYRQLILNGDKDFKKVKSIYDNQNIFELEGEMYKRSKAPLESEEIKNWVDRKYAYLSCHSKDFKLLYNTSEFVKKISKEFLSLAPAYKFFLKVSNMK